MTCLFADCCQIIPTFVLTWSHMETIVSADPWQGISDCCLMPTQQFFSYIMLRTIFFPWDDDEVSQLCDWFKPKTIKLVFVAKYAALRRKSIDLLAWNQDSVSKWNDMSIRRLLFQWASIIKIQLSITKSLQNQMNSNISIYKKKQ
jgi:hypothetical protein